MPRVITGEYRGTVLFAPKGDNTRPTTDKVKEALFSMIQGRVEGSRFLDLFSGTGQMGIEALSRGAQSVVLVDKAGSAVSVIKRNLEKIRADNDPRIKVMKMPTANALEKLAQDGAKFDIIYMDPPYKIAQRETERAASLIKQYGLLSEDGILIAEHASDEPFNADVIDLQFVRSCSYGLCVVTFFCNSKTSR